MREDARQGMAKARRVKVRERSVLQAQARSSTPRLLRSGVKATPPSSNTRRRVASTVTGGVACPASNVSNTATGMRATKATSAVSRSNSARPRGTATASGLFSCEPFTLRLAGPQPFAALALCLLHAAQGSDLERWAGLGSAPSHRP